MAIFAAMRLQPPPHPRPRPPIVLLLLLIGPVLTAQTDTIVTDGTDDEYQQQLIEDIVNNAGNDSDEFSFNAAFDLLETYRKRPLNLNRATYDELLETLLLSPIQIGQLLEYRDRMNGFISPYELQVIPSMTLDDVRRVQPYLRIGGELDDVKTPLGRMIAEGDREGYVRWNRNLETAEGYERDGSDGRQFYLGSPDRLYTRFRSRFGNKLSFGFTAEKDPGEAFFAENNRKRGFDYYSAHFFVRGLNRTVKAVVIGDYNVSFGQGLVLFTGFSFGKSSQTTNIARGGPTLRPYTSVNEFSFMRGAATTLAFGKKMELTAFGSRRGVNGNRIGTISVLDTIEQEVLSFNVSSLDVSGFNRTPSQVIDRNALRMYNYGGSLMYRPFGNLKLALNALGTRLDNRLFRRSAAYSRFFFQGDRLTNVSLDYRYRLRNFTFFGELATSHNPTPGQEKITGYAQIHGLMLGLNRYADLCVLYRDYGVRFQSLFARPFGETATGRNEQGLYFGLELRPSKHWRVNAYYDLFRFPYFRFNVDAPDQGHEYRFRVTYWQKRKLETYLELRSETKGFGLSGEIIDPVVPRTRFQGRLHFAYKITPQLEWRSRIDAGFTEDVGEGRQTGLMLYQGLHYRSRGAWSLSGRVGFFNTADFDVRFYQYENGLLYNARVVPYYGRGTRSYLLVRYKGIRQLTVEARIAQTFFTDGREVGSGLEATGGPVRTEVGGQVIYRF